MIELGFLLTFLTIGYVFGRAEEARHYKSILEREEKLRDLLLIQSRFPPEMHPAPRSLLVTGSVVLSADYFRMFVASLRSLLGGRLRSYESMIDRARREAVLRMKEEAIARGAILLVNVKFEAVTLAGKANRGIQCVEGFAYATALLPAAR